MNDGRPLSGILYVVLAVGIAVAWSRGYLTPITNKLSELLAGPVNKRPIVLRPVGAFGTGARLS